MNMNDLNNPKTVTVLTGLMTSGLFGPLAVIGAVGISIYGISKLFADEEDNTDELDDADQNQEELLEPNEQLESQRNQQVEPYKEPLNQQHDYGTPTVQPTASPTAETTVKTTVLDGEMGIVEPQESSHEDKQELIRKAMSELGKKSAEARRRKKAGL